LSKKKVACNAPVSRKKKAHLDDRKVKLRCQKRANVHEKEGGRDRPVLKIIHK